MRQKEPELLSLDDHISLLDRFDAAEQDYKDEIYGRMFMKTECDAATDCMIYTGCWEDSGQAKIRVGAQVYIVSRVSAWLFFDGFKLWSRQRVVRTCDAPACWQPSHLKVLASQAAAMEYQRNTGRIGDPRRQLNRKKAEAMRRQHEDGASIPELVERTGLQRRSVRAVILGRTWAP